MNKMAELMRRERAKGIWAEVVEDGNGKQLGADEAAERLVIYAERIRKERNMDNGSSL